MKAEKREAQRKLQSKNLTTSLLKEGLEIICYAIIQFFFLGLINRFCHLLAIYRKHCADPSSIGQLILPERLKVGFQSLKHLIIIMILGYAGVYVVSDM